MEVSGGRTERLAIDERRGTAGGKRSPRGVCTRGQCRAAQGLEG